jgi:hypothetical protein
MVAGEGPKPVVLVAMEPRTYREVLGQALATLRSGIEVRVVEPRDAAREARRLRADVVFSSLPPATDVESVGALWVEIAVQNNLNAQEAETEDTPEDVGHFGLEYMLNIVDEAVGCSGPESSTG